MDQNGDAKTSTGLQPNVAGLLAYLAGVITGIVFLVIEKENKFVRFHAMQSILVWVSLVIVSIVASIVGAILGHIPYVGWIISMLVWLLITVLWLGLWLFLMYKAYQGQLYKLPVIGDIAEKQIQK
jgi:uncharacterized membrane protein